MASVLRCTLCKGADALLELTPCGHTFHPRCIHTWPIVACQVCHAPSPAVRVVRMKGGPSGTALPPRRTWFDSEKEYCDVLLALFHEGSLPLVKGVHLRPTLATLLHCNPMRITKKFKQHAQLGKQLYAYNNASPTSLTHAYKRHVQTQKNVTMLRDAFYWQIQAHGGGRAVVEAMRHAEAQFWRDQLVPFCKLMGQPILSIDDDDDAVETAPHEMTVTDDETNEQDNDDRVKTELRAESPAHVEHAADAPLQNLSQLQWTDIEIVHSEVAYGPWASGDPEQCSLGFIIDEDGLVQFESMYVDDSVWSAKP
ncbi:hypothetical protein SPRG_06443 [Saprolegnia parasitica CBS 223.65]|uniref:RING-type domain-containing protein n=1 Tax=Saprolegnia parasitica (strain CBS 223.65) TaxID=695850 RepID=A0A067CP51_SAPPC|nr:hypothetical protein SPRG_06443 [Saprolegnia parasitica CBS 223.65]KDO28587.1 hypothetical protein SPRG_06443 [Saprolegnia parasitica CBS 223.65]|eukprot:XP_012200650.1 hypothetical protein SPRG_06443 [Saprolegnia parasitica CBS 223.65]